MENTEAKTEESTLPNDAIALPAKKDTFVYSIQKDDAGIYSPKGYEQKNIAEKSDAKEQSAQQMEIIWKKLEKEHEASLNDHNYIDITTKAKVAKTNHPYEKEHMELLQNFMVEEGEAYQQQMLNERMTRELLIKANEKKE